MTKKFHIPPTKDAILADIDTKSALLTATGWELAAELAAIVRLSDVQGRHVSSDMTSAVDIADLGYRGLKSKNTVERYVNIWLAKHGGTYPEPGETVTIPDGVFPPEDKNIGTRMPKTPKAIVAKAIEEHGAAAVAEALAEEAEAEMLDAVEKKANAKLPGKGRPAPTPAMVSTSRMRVLELCDSIRNDLAQLGRELDANAVQADTDEERALQHLAADMVTVLGAYSVSASVDEAMADLLGRDQ